MKLAAEEKRLYSEWEEFLKSLREDSVVDKPLDYADREQRRRKLEADPVAWILELFPKYAKYPFAPFHKRAIKRILEHPDNWYEVLSWSRELAKSTVTMFIVMYLVLTGKKKNIILVSNSLDNATKLLSVYRGQFETNKRIAYYYGNQCGAKWTENAFTTKSGVSFLALGARQSPRGNKNDNVRPDCLLMDDYDTDEECRNPDIINDKWKWFEEALYFTRSFSEPLLTIWCGNVIAKDCCITRAGARANELAAREKPLGHWDVVNLRMVNINKPNPKDDFAFGTTVWAAKNSEEKIDEVLAQVSSAAAQKECFNNPVTEGLYFREIRWGDVPPLNKFPFLVSYGDPAPSNKVSTRKGVKKLGSLKSNVLLGVLGGKLYVINAFLDHVVNDEFVNWYYYQREYVGDKTTIYNFIENNKLQDPFYEQVFVPLFRQKAVETGRIISIAPDLRVKPDKFSRIEGNLEPINRAGNIIFNVAERDNPHMKRLEEQFLLFDDGLPAPADGPDAVEGGFFKAQEKLCAVSTGSWTVGTRQPNKKRY